MIVTLTGPSGSGKTTIAGGIRELFCNTKPIVSYTTRAPRSSDLSGEYEHISLEEFEAMKARGEFMWTVFVHGTHYGTAVKSLEDALREPYVIFYIILIPEKVKVIQEYVQKMNGTIVSFYILSPPEALLRKRLEERGDSPADIEKRISDCLTWDGQAINSTIPYVFVNNENEGVRVPVNIIGVEILRRMEAL